MQGSLQLIEAAEIKATFQRRFGAGHVNKLQNNNKIDSGDMLKKKLKGLHLLVLAWRTEQLSAQYSQEMRCRREGGNLACEAA